MCAALRDYVNQKTAFSALTEADFPALDPCRLTICTAGTDLTGHRLSDMLWSEFGIACEMADDRNVVCILTGSDPKNAISRLKRALRQLSRRREARPMPPVTAPFPPAERVMSVRDAWFSQNGRVQPAAAEGLVCARPVTPYPPGVPLLWPGEKITGAHVALIRERWYNTIDEISVVVK